MIGHDEGLADAVGPALTGVLGTRERLGKTRNPHKQLTATPPTDPGNITANGVAVGGQSVSSTLRAAGDGVGGMGLHSWPKRTVCVCGDSISSVCKGALCIANPL